MKIVTLLASLIFAAGIASANEEAADHSKHTAPAVEKKEHAKKGEMKEMKKTEVLKAEMKKEEKKEEKK